MVATTPFHERLAPLNETGLWSHWSGRLAAVKYQMAEKFEYFAIRNAAALIDTFAEDWIHPADVAAGPRSVERIVDRGWTVSEMRLRRRDGTYVWVANSTSAVKDPISGRLV